MNDNINVSSNIKKLELYSDNCPFNLSLRIKNFENEVEYKKFVKNCEILIRRCQEYKLWKSYIIDVLQYNKCLITQEVIDEVSIEVHHHIPSLYVLVSGIVNKKIDNNEEFCTFDIAQTAIELHFKNQIGYVTLIKSMHEKFHNGALDIPIDIIKGNYNNFLNGYTKFIDEDDLDKINTRLSINTSNCKWSKDDYLIAREG